MGAILGINKIHREMEEGFQVLNTLRLRTQF